jgi:hypothetical protein
MCVALYLDTASPVSILCKAVKCTHITVAILALRNSVSYIHSISADMQLCGSWASPGNSPTEETKVRWSRFRTGKGIHETICNNDLINTNSKNFYVLHSSHFLLATLTINLCITIIITVSWPWSISNYVYHCPIQFLMLYATTRELPKKCLSNLILENLATKFRNFNPLKTARICFI